MSDEREPFSSAYAAFLRARAELAMSDVVSVDDETGDALFVVERAAVQRVISSEVRFPSDMSAKLSLLRQFADEEQVMGRYLDRRLHDLARQVCTDFHDWQFREQTSRERQVDRDHRAGQ